MQLETAHFFSNRSFVLSVAVAFLTLLAWPALASACDITLQPGDNIQSLIDANPSGTSFCFAPGVYRLTKGIQAKSGSLFYSAGGAIISGAKPVTSFISSATGWVAYGVVQTNPIQSGDCFPTTYAGCRYAEAVFYDDQPLWRVDTIDELRPGTFYIDYSRNDVYLADDPSGHKVEIAVATRAFVSWGLSIENVTIQGLVIEKFANESASCALEGRSGWSFRYNEVRLNHGTGICDGDAIVGNYVHHNGQMGVMIGFSSGALLDNNEISYNNISGFSWGDAGGTKFMNTTNLTVSNNYAHHNTGPGLWGDGGNIQTVYEGNTTRSNLSAGILHELSDSAVIRKNLIVSDGFNPFGTSLSIWWGSGISLNGSSNVEIYGNTVINCMNGISAVWTNRIRPDGTPYLLENLNVHTNVVVQPTGTAAGIASDSMLAFTSWNNRFGENTYWIGSLDGTFFHWMGDVRDGDQWRGYGMDVDGTFLLDR